MSRRTAEQTAEALIVECGDVSPARIAEMAGIRVVRRKPSELPVLSVWRQEDGLDLIEIREDLTERGVDLAVAMGMAHGLAARFSALPTVASERAWAKAFAARILEPMHIEPHAYVTPRILGLHQAVSEVAASAAGAVASSWLVFDGAVVLVTGPLRTLVSASHILSLARRVSEEGDVPTSEGWRAFAPDDGTGRVVVISMSAAASLPTLYVDAIVRGDVLALTKAQAQGRARLTSLSDLLLRRRA